MSIVTAILLCRRIVIATRGWTSKATRSDALSGGTSRHVDERQDVHLVLIWSPKACQRVGQAARFRLTLCGGVIRHQSHDPFGCRLLTEPFSTVERMKPGVGDRVCIADVVEPRGHDNSLRDVDAPHPELLG